VIDAIKRKIGTWCLMVALFFNPFGFDIIQYWLVSLTGSLWSANFVLYCVAGVFFGLSIFFQYFYKNDQIKKNN